jgi:hypothetical protein
MTDSPAARLSGALRKAHGHREPELEPEPEPEGKIHGADPKFRKLTQQFD